MQRSDYSQRIAVGVLALVLTLLAASATFAQAPATAKAYCEALASEYVFPDKIQDDTIKPPYYGVRDLTQADKDALLETLRSKCMLDSATVTSHWDGKSVEERKAFFGNYDLIAQAVPEASYNVIFPDRVAAYTYEAFLKSAMAFPYLCGEDGETLDTCKREFATMFAHWWQETSGLIYLNEGTCANGGCASYVDATTYFYDARAVEASPDPKRQYFGRGPKQLSYNYNYGRFSWQYFKDMRFTENPYLLVTDEYIDESFVSGFWFYMTPVSQKPSMHEVVTGLWQPNAVDDADNIKPGFGATINIINGALECGKGTEQPGAANRIAFYVGGTAQEKVVNGTLRDLGLDPSLEQNLSCKDQKPFSLGGDGSHALYYNHSRYWQCELMYSEQPFTLYDYSHFKSSLGVACANGLDCCQKTQAKLKTYPENPPPPTNPPFALREFYEWLGVPGGGAATSGAVGPLLLLDEAQ